MDENKSTALAELGKEALSQSGHGIGWLVTHSPKRVAVECFIKDVQKSNLNAEDKALLTYHAREIAKGNNNISDIVKEAKKHLVETANPSKVDEDWQNLFLDRARIVSSDEFKIIWGRILASECNKPGTIRKSLLLTLESMDRDDAGMFMKLANLCIEVGNFHAPIIDNHRRDAYKKFGISLDSCIRLEQLGLIKTNFSEFTNGYAIGQEENESEVHYFGHVKKMPNGMGEVPVGAIILTKDGEALYSSVDTTEVEGYWDQYIELWLDSRIKTWKESQKSVNA